MKFFATLLLVFSAVVQGSQCAVGGGTIGGAVSCVAKTECPKEASYCCVYFSAGSESTFQQACYADAKACEAKDGHMGSATECNSAGRVAGSLAMAAPLLALYFLN